MRVARMVWGVALLIAVPGSAGRAADPESDYDRCINATTSNMEWAACGRDEIQRQEAGLRDAWARVVTLATGWEAGVLEALQAEQRQWEAWKNSACSLYATSAFGREGQVLSYPVCRAGVIAARAKQLNGFADEIETRR